MIRNSFIAALVVISSGSSVIAETPEKDKSPLERVKLWTLLSLEEKPIHLSKPMTFTFENGRVSVSGGVNRLSATYTLNGSKITIGPVMSTRTAGDPALMALDAKVSETLTTVDEFSAGSEGLSLLSKGKIAAQLSAQKSSD